MVGVNEGQVAINEVVEGNREIVAYNLQNLQEGIMNNAHNVEQIAGVVNNQGQLVHRALGVAANEFVHVGQNLAHVAGGQAIVADRLQNVIFEVQGIGEVLVGMSVINRQNLGDLFKNLNQRVILANRNIRGLSDHYHQQIVGLDVRIRNLEAARTQAVLDHVRFAEDIGANAGNIIALRAEVQSEILNRVIAHDATAAEVERLTSIVLTLFP